VPVYDLLNGRSRRWCRRRVQGKPTTKILKNRAAEESRNQRRGVYLSTVAMMTQLPQVGPKPHRNPHPQRLARSSLLSVGSITWSYLRAPSVLVSLNIIRMVEKCVTILYNRGSIFCGVSNLWVSPTIWVLYSS
jgi:hypothetical protein